jgi:hypothetical protein
MEEAMRIYNIQMTMKSVLEKDAQIDRVEYEP